MNRRIAALALVALVTLSGCAGVFGGSGTTTSPSGTTTPPTDATTTTSTTTTQSETLAPGITREGGITDFETLLATHTDVLESTGYETSTRVVTELPDRNVAPRTIRYAARVGKGGQPYRITVTTTIGNQTTQQRGIYGNDSVRLDRTRKLTGSGNWTTKYEHLGARTEPVDPAIGGFRQVFAAGDWTVDAVEGTGDDRQIVLVARGPTENGLASLGANVSEYRGRVVVDGQGLIHQVDLDTTYTDAYGRHLVADVHYEIGAQRDVAVFAPDWSESALAATDDVTIEAQLVDGTYVAIENTGSEPIPDGTEVAVVTNSGVGKLTVQGSVAPGETIYFYQRQGSGAELATEKPTGDLAPIGRSFRLVLRNGDGDRIASVDVHP